MTGMMICVGGVWAEDKVGGRPPAPVGESGPADWWDRVTFDGEAVHGLERGVEMEYNLSWNGIIKAGELDVRIELPGGDEELIEATATGKSTGLARALWEYDFEMASKVKPEGWEPRGLKFVEEDGKEVTTVETSFVEKGVRYTRSKEYKKKKMGEPPEPKSYSIVIPRMHDIASAILYLRSLDLADGDEATVMIVPYDSAYLVTFRVLGREEHKSKVGKVPAIKVDVRIKKIHRGTMELEEHKKFKKGTIWVSDDEYRMPLEIRAAIFVGDVRATITGRGELAHDRRSG
ncbi:MAG: DUF3108 domain-containing protein [Verrucomicrobiota bacterium]